MNVCPHCQRKLLSQASARCNWCGETIEDAQYQARAENEREAFFAHQATKDAESLANIGRINVNGVDPWVDPFSQGLLGVGGSPGPTQRRAARAEAAFQEKLALERRAATLLAQKQAAEAEECVSEPEATETQERFRHLEV